MRKFGLVIIMMTLIFSPALLFAAKKNYDKNLAQSLAGKFLLQVEDRGKIWYVSPKDNKRYEIRFDKIVDMSDTLGYGITHKDITKIPIKVVSLGQFDDTDDDDFYDRDEALRGFDPYSKSTEKVTIDKEFAMNQKGKIFLEVDGNGRLWYVDMNGERWNLEWYMIMDMLKEVSLGITNANLEKIEMGDPLKTIKPDRYITCRDSIDCMVAASAQCMSAGGFGESSYFYDNNKIEMHVGVSYDIYPANEDGSKCNLRVFGSSIYPELEDSYYWDVYNKVEEQGYSSNEMSSILQGRDISYGSIDQTSSECTYSTDVYVNLFKEFKNQGVQVFDSFFDIPESGEHSCYNSMFYGYTNPGNLAMSYDRTFKSLADIYVESVKNNINYYTEPYVSLEGDGMSDSMTDQATESEMRTQRNIQRREDMATLLSEFERLCSEGIRELDPVATSVVDTYFVNVNSANANLNIETGLPYTLDPVDVGVCTTDSQGCEYTLMLDQATGKVNTCDPYILYQIEEDDNGHALSCVTHTQQKEGITHVNACK